jgi:acetyltransferase
LNIKFEESKMNNQFDNFFYPSTICIAGASTKEHSIGYELLKNIKQFDYKGTVLPVNPNAESVLGYKCYSSIDEINVNIDLAIVLVPKKYVMETIDDLLAEGVKAIVLITAGFRETGNEGENLERIILNKVKNANARLVGPNCMGLINSTQTNLNATFISEMPLQGRIAYLSQSGALGATILNSLRETNIKFAHFLSVGNKADVNENDMLLYWQDDKNISVLTYYLESFDNGFEFLKLFLLCKISKPVIVLKAGSTKSGMRAAASHTGALSSEDRVVGSLLNQAGIIRVETVNEMFNTAKSFESLPIPKGNKVAVVTNAGGPAILLTDKLDKEGLQLSNLSENTKLKLKESVHPEGSVNNPVDLLPHGNEISFPEVIKILINDENVDTVVSLFVEPGVVKPIPVIESINNISSDKPIFSVMMTKPEFWDEYTNISKPVFKNPEEPAEVISNMLFHSRTNKKRAKWKNEIVELFDSNNKNIFSFKSGFIEQIETAKICKHYNFPLVKEIIVDSAFINEIDIDFYPVVIKGISKDVIHKSELNAVILNINNAKELLDSASEIKNNFTKNGFTVEQFLVQQFISTKHEVLLGGYRDKSFGPVIMFGTGGKYVEVINDTAIRSAYISKEEIKEMIAATSIGKILAGVRGEDSIDMEKLITLIQSAAKMLIENEGIIEFDFNPIIVDNKNELHAVDVRVKF